MKRDEDYLFRPPSREVMEDAGKEDYSERLCEARGMNVVPPQREQPYHTENNTDERERRNICLPRHDATPSNKRNKWIDAKKKQKEYSRNKLNPDIKPDSIADEIKTILDAGVNNGEVVKKLKDNQFKPGDAVVQDYFEEDNKLPASEIADMLMDYFDFCVIDGQLYQYQAHAGFWCLLPDSMASREIRRIIPGNVRKTITRSKLLEIYEWLLNDARKVYDNPQDRKYILNFLDCAYDWKNKKIITDRKHLHFRYAIQYEYHELTENGSLENFLNDLFPGDKKTKREFRKFLGLCLSDIRNLKRSFFLLGPSNTGKSVVLNLLHRVIGEPWSSSLSFAQMSNEFAITQLMGKRVNLSGEVSGASNKRLDIFKSLTGNDTITACYKGKDHFQFKNESLLVFACNDLPYVAAVTEFESYLERVVIFPFDHVIPRSQWIDQLDQILYNDSKSIVAEAIKGLQALEEDGFCFNETEAMMRCKESYFARDNSFGLFIQKHIEEDVDGIVPSETIQNEYSVFCRENGLTPVATNTWSALLKQRFTVSRVTMTKDGDRRRGYKGICLCNLNAHENFEDELYKPVEIA